MGWGSCRGDEQKVSRTRVALAAVRATGLAPPQAQCTEESRALMQCVASVLSAERYVPLFAPTRLVGVLGAWVCIVQ